MLPSAGTSVVVCANWTCGDFLHFAEIVAVLVLGLEHQHLAVVWHMLQRAVIHYQRAYEECHAPADGEDCQRVNEYIKKLREEGFNCLLTYAQILPEPAFVGQWDHALWDSGRLLAQTMRAVDMFEGTGPGCMGAVVQPSTLGAPATRPDCEVALAKYRAGICALEPKPAWKDEYQTRGLNPHEIK
eukprot:jgi/Tetstr1/446126/TSEL_033726.t1